MYCEGQKKEQEQEQEEDETYELEKHVTTSKHWRGVNLLTDSWRGSPTLRRDS